MSLKAQALSCCCFVSVHVCVMWVSSCLIVYSLTELYSRCNPKVILMSLTTKTKRFPEVFLRCQPHVSPSSIQMLSPSSCRQMLHKLTRTRWFPVYMPAACYCQTTHGLMRLHCFLFLPSCPLSVCGSGRASALYYTFTQSYIASIWCETYWVFAHNKQNVRPCNIQHTMTILEFLSFTCNSFSNHMSASCTVWS